MTKEHLVTEWGRLEELIGIVEPQIQEIRKDIIKMESLKRISEFLETLDSSARTYGEAIAVIYALLTELPKTEESYPLFQKRKMDLEKAFEGRGKYIREVIDGLVNSLSQVV